MPKGQMKENEEEEEEKKIIQRYMNYLEKEEMLSLFNKTEFIDEAEQHEATKALIEILRNDPESVPMLRFRLLEAGKEVPPIWTAKVIYKTAETMEGSIKEALQSLRPKKIEGLKVALNVIEMTLSIRSDKTIITNAVERVKEDLLWYKEHIISLLEEEENAGYLKQGSAEKKGVPEKEEVAPESFDDIFTAPDWLKYIIALETVDPPILKVMNRGDIRFTGTPKKHKGVLCAWINDLQTMGEIKRGISRQQLAHVLNKEISDLDLGRDGKTIHNQSYLYDNNYKKELLDIIK